ncbi:hypothetical protein FCJ61_03560 [Burkholderia metallica]|uniref:hypothetical protein n=1 Tax=Burkholderia metallica TaxID=488729 RepID=UPI00157A7F74|nr:hypothetical protein [Burkholderia metallica]NTZ82118.1 hypothetical protein [Burkholderia metallica]
MNGIASLSESRAIRRNLRDACPADETLGAVSSGAARRRTFLNDLSKIRRPLPVFRFPPARSLLDCVENRCRHAAQEKECARFPALFFNTWMDGYQIEIA